MKNFLMTESEKSRILGMHYNAMGKTLVNEQGEGGLIKNELSLKPLPDNLHLAYLNVVNEKDSLALRISTPPYELTPARIKNKSYDVEFTVDNQNRTKTKRYYYQCIDSEPNQKERNFKAGQIFDSSDRISSDVASDLDSTGGPWREMFSWACKPAMAVLAARKAKEQPQAQVAGAKVMAPNPLPDVDVAAVQKREAETKAKTEKATTDLKTLMDSPGFLKLTDSNGDLITDKTTLNTQVKELNRLLMAGAILDSMAKQELINNIRRIIKYFPEYKESPYDLSVNMF
jgi:hypothetical protein